MKFDLPLLQFIAQESKKEVKNVITISIVAGLASALLIALVNNAAGKVAAKISVTLEFFLYAFLLISFILLMRKLAKESIQATQSLIHKFKMRLMREVFSSNLGKLDEIGRANILQALGRDAQMISQSIPGMIGTCQALSALIFMSFYMATISVFACLIIALASIVILYFSSRFITKVDKALRDAWKRELQNFEIFSDFLNGFKEIKMNSLRARDISLLMVESSRNSTQIKANALITLSHFFNYLQVLLYVTVGIIIFIAPMFSTDFSSSVLPATTVTIFLVGSLSSVIVTIPMLTEANISARSLLNLEKELQDSKVEDENPSSVQNFDSLKTLELRNISYEYASNQLASGFSVGPINYTFEAGKIYFIRGGNGSGKTTIMRILLGLITPSQGEILLNGKVVNFPAASVYRDLFSVVFSDFYLFKKTYGLNNCSIEMVEEWISLLQMEDKIKIEGENFSDINLSTGQKKRLALLVALMEERQIVVLDEWAADQDPEFRSLFYKKILPIFIQMGKTVIAITHDDAYFKTADHLITIVDGKIANT